MKLTTQFLNCILLITTIAAGCDKGGSGSNNNTPTPREILTSRTWAFSEYRENGVVMVLKAPCDMDDVFTFNTNGNYTRNNGANRCDPAQPATFSDGWSLSADNKTLNILSEVSGDLYAISENSFTVRRTGANVFDYTYVKK